ncbi:nuclear transport factor 2 family protein [Acidovorax sp. SDU_ACID1]|uniref:nuclear transport factor 2 family protein n=1 Tax=Acidovorax sp. SDU_ACID1 TaxID=3136632 RepID=UPI003872DF15
MTITHSAGAPPFLTVEEAQAHFDSRAALYNDRNVEAILDGLEDDAEIHYGDLPVMHGKKAFEPVLRKRLESFTCYHLQKTVRLVQGNVVLTELDIQWAGEASQGQPRRTRAFEILTFRGKKLAKWELVSSPRPPNLP